ncbi:16S rRNA (guanine(966)-N(2))-methyltransferase RsmD [Legionella yabuuchiae]|uniref:16S rRNA (guanine(966)-N(2))-methyltransferase RsmD n=1 Tax=Legionella yabuuchiae TaxID=376727 RepID=UPI0010566CE8|nr:16S rRNA (guanine(966)-N(2))-methyltransferase RsmD [Legionella yabuuchiae]
MKQVIRIIGGQYRGKKIHFPAITGLRPTPDRVRETLFNWLMSIIRGSRCLDAFAGSGALGFEAHSRGAAKVVMVEESSKAYSHLLNEAKAFEPSGITIIKGDAYRYLKETQEQFDIIFLDPPFAQNYLPLIQALEHKNVLVPTGYVYIESPQEIELNPLYWKKLKLKQSGQVFYGLYQKLN